MKARWWGIGFVTGLGVGFMLGWNWTWSRFVFDRQEAK